MPLPLPRTAPQTTRRDPATRWAAPFASVLLAAALLLLLSLLFAACGQARSGGARPVPPPDQLRASSSSHVVVIVMENKEASEVIGTPDAPFTTKLAGRYGLATSSFAIKHPSVPNYIALTSGSTQGIDTDCTDCRVGARNLASQLETAHVSWKAYLEGLPHRCFLGAASTGGYAKKHNPFAYYDDIVKSPSRCKHLVPFTRLGRDMRRGRLPTFAWITPNLCNDMHDCGVGAGDRFLARVVPSVLRVLGPRGFLVVTWDEGASDRGCCGTARGGRIATIVAGPRVRRASRDSTPVNHYGVLRTIEDALRLPRLSGANDASNGDLTGLFAEPPGVR
jgi:hypothetical protein